MVSDSRVTWTTSANFSLPRPLCSRVRPDVRDRQTDRQMLDVRQKHRLMRRHDNDCDAHEQRRADPDILSPRHSADPKKFLRICVRKQTGPQSAHISAYELSWQMFAL